MYRCWASDPAKRPSALELVKDLDLIARYKTFTGADAKTLPPVVRTEAHALYHQAVAGNCEQPQPRLWQIGARGHWRAWKELVGMKPSVALDKMKRSVALDSRVGARWHWRAWKELVGMKRSVALDKLHLLLDDVSPRWRQRAKGSFGAPPPSDADAAKKPAKKPSAGSFDRRGRVMVGGEGHERSASKTSTVSSKTSTRGESVSSRVSSRGGSVQGSISSRGSSSMNDIMRLESSYAASELGSQGEGGGRMMVWGNGRGGGAGGGGGEWALGAVSRCLILGAGVFLR
ncbi:hypothetical protein T484DRAFT_1833038 [Baffinella frigidus]|nr:hypothetical protein T484DRAFT_1833038 [Cryptophyta sp. CCMP2293]